MVYLSLYALVGLLIGWKMGPKEWTWKKLGLLVLFAVFWLPYLLFLAVFMVLVRYYHKGD